MSSQQPVRAGTHTALLVLCFCDPRRGTDG
jgi:hypothetical protein